MTMEQENAKKAIDVEKAKEMAKSPKGKIGAVISVVVILAIIGILTYIFTRPDDPNDYKYELTITDATIT